MTKPQTTVGGMLKSTGEMFEYPASTPREVAKSYAEVDEIIETYRSIRHALTVRGMKLLQETLKDGK